MDTWMSFALKAEIIMTKRNKNVLSLKSLMSGLLKEENFIVLLILKLNSVMSNKSLLLYNNPYYNINIL